MNLKDAPPEIVAAAKRAAVAQLNFHRKEAGVTPLLKQVPKIWWEINGASFFETFTESKSKLKRLAVQTQKGTK